MIQKQTQTLSARDIRQLHDVPCPACGSKELVDFFEVEKLPIHVGMLFDTPQQARRAATGSVTLSYCRGCGLVHNRRYDPTNVSFEPTYEVALHHSEMFRNFMRGVAERLVGRYDLHNKTIIEIGCGCGYFLRQLCELGGNAGIGFDTSVAKEGLEKLSQGSVQFVRDYYGQRYAGLEPDFITCLSVFEDIAQPAEFLKNIRNILGNRPVEMYFEVFNAFRAFQSAETWSIHYEQCNYYSDQSFTDLFRRNGFEVLDAGPCYGKDQYLYVEAKPCDILATAKPGGDEAQQEIPAEIARFAELHRATKAGWNRRLETFRQQGRRAVVWGSGGKGISFLNGTDSQCIEYAVDINPDRQNKFLPGTAQKVVAPEFLVEYRPDVIILTNVLYQQEIQAQLDSLRVKAEFQVA